MKWSAYFFVFLVTIFSWAQISQDDDIELQQMLNGRSSANFLKSTSNIQVVLPAKTKAKVVEIKNFPATGNQGLFVEVQSGPYKGEKFWVYNNKDKKNIVVIDPKNSREKNKDPEKDDTVLNKKKQKAYRDSEDSAPKTTADQGLLDATKSALGKIGQAQEGVNRLNNPEEGCSPCKHEEMYQMAGHGRAVTDRDNKPARAEKSPRSEADEIERCVVPPAMNYSTRFEVCLNKSFPELGSIHNMSYDEIKNYKSKLNSASAGSAQGFKLIGWDLDEKLNIDPTGDSKNASALKREWIFSAQNMYSVPGVVRVRNGYHNGNKGLSSFESELVFLPRKSKAQYNADKDRNRVTMSLTNSEDIDFNLSTGKITSGVLTENKPVLGRPPEFKYSGQGVMIQVDAKVGNGKVFQDGIEQIKIQKKGQTCVRPGSEYSQMPKSDRDLNSWLQSKCGFGF